MGSYLSRNRAEVEEVNISPNSTYRYPPKAGNFFSSHFVMGGEKFETIQPEAYLFGENTDLNFLGPKPFDVPYRISTPGQPLKALRCLANIRKDSLRLVKIPRLMGKPVQKDNENGETTPHISSDEGSFMYNVEFTFDTDAPCSITIYYNATEDMVNKNVIYSPDPPRNASDTVHFNAGSNQQFCLPAHCIDPAELSTYTVDWTKGYTKIPIVIQICADCGPTIVGHSHITYAEFYKPTENSWSVRTVKQKQAINGVCYLIQEIFGIENKNSNADDDDDDNDDDSSDCVVCLSELRDTMILPCRHLCLCSTCANQLRYQQSGCPICRQSFRALLRVRAVRLQQTNNAALNRRRDSVDSEGEEEEEDIPVPPGYEVVPLIEAIRGNNISTSRSGSSVSDVPTPSTSRDEVSIIDETSKPSVGLDEVMIVTDDSDTDEDNEEPAVNIIFKECTPSDLTVKKCVNDSDSPEEQGDSHMYEEIRLPVGSAEDESYEKGDSSSNVKEFVKKTKKVEPQKTSPDNDTAATISVKKEEPTTEDVTKPVDV